MKGIDVAGTTLDSLKQIGLGLLMPNQSCDNVATILASMTETVESLGPAIQNAIAEFTKGFTASTSEIATPVRTIVDSITHIVKSFDTEEAHKTFNALGELIGAAFMGSAEIVQGVAAAFESLMGNIFKKNEQGHSLGTVMTTLAEAFTSLKNVVTNITSNFFKGFSDALKDIMTPINNALKPLKDLLGLLDDKDTKGGLGKAFRTLGAILGDAFLTVIAAVATVLDLIAKTIRSIIALISGKEDIGQLWKDFGSRALQNGKAVASAFSVVGAIWKEPDDPEVAAIVKDANKTLADNQVHDAIITKTGQVIRTDPDDTIIAAKQIIGGGDRGGKGSGGNNPITITFGPTYVTVTEGDAEKAGRDFGQSAAQSIAARLSREMLLEGY